MSILRRIAATLIVLLPVMLLIGCGSGSNNGSRGHIAFQSGASGPSNIMIMNADGGAQQLVVADGTSPSVRRDGQAVAFARGRDIFVINVNGTGLTNVTNHGLGVTASSPAYSPTGDIIAYVMSPVVASPVPAIHLVSSNGTGDVELVADANEPTWNPNGTAIAFSRGADIWQINVDGTGLQQITDHGVGVAAHHPSYSPFADKIAYASETTGSPSTTSVRLINLGDGSETALIANASQPAFSPFGGEVAFVQDGKIFSISTLGTDLRQLTAGPADSSPSWAR